MLKYVQLPVCWRRGAHGLYLQKSPAGDGRGKGTPMLKLVLGNKEEKIELREMSRTLGAPFYRWVVKDIISM